MSNFARKFMIADTETDWKRNRVSPFMNSFMRDIEWYNTWADVCRHWIEFCIVSTPQQKNMEDFFSTALIYAAMTEYKPHILQLFSAVMYRWLQGKMREKLRSQTLNLTSKNWSFSKHLVTR